MGWQKGTREISCAPFLHHQSLLLDINISPPKFPSFFHSIPLHPERPGTVNTSSPFCDVHVCCTFCSLDIYMPDSRSTSALDSALRHNGAQPADAERPLGQALKPVLLFVHGGVWASGDKWQVLFCSWMAQKHSCNRGSYPEGHQCHQIEVHLI